jgi:serine/threonine-protein kinase
MSTLAAGDEFRGYIVADVLGRGGNATVYRAHRADLPGVPDSDVALKVLHPDRCKPDDLARLKREFTLARQLHHPHIVTMDKSGPYWLAMGLVDGGGTAPGLDGLADKLTALAQMADALDYAHANGIVHCDVKPTNFLVAEDFAERGAVLTDFGVAHVVADEVGELPPAHIEASLPYAAPELLRGEPPSAASDEYALACTAVELLTGSPPFTASTTMGIVAAHLNKAPPRISRNRDWVPHAVDSILAKAMTKTPDRRYDSAGEFISLIARALR